MSNFTKIRKYVKDMSCLKQAVEKLGHSYYAKQCTINDYYSKGHKVDGKIKLKGGGEIGLIKAGDKGFQFECDTHYYGEDVKQISKLYVENVTRKEVGMRGGSVLKKVAGRGVDLVVTIP